MTLPSLGLLDSLSAPRETLNFLFRAGTKPPWITWLLLVIIAVVGSLIFGSSLGFVFKGWDKNAAAIWLALSSGLAWCIFIPALRAITKARWTVCFHACLVTMAYGEIVLLQGAMINVLELTAANPLGWNISVVGISNIVMAGTLAFQLQAVGVHLWKTLMAWVLILNGCGAFFFWLFYNVLKGVA